MKARAALLALVLALVATACSDDAASDATTTTAPAETTAPAGSSSTMGPVGPSTTEPNGEELVLRGDGLGVTDFGASPADAISALTTALGPPTKDTGWEPAFSSYGTCPGEQIRGVEWDGLVLLFTDGETAEASGEHLFTWRVTGAPPAIGTALGLGWGATASDAAELYLGLVQLTPPEDPFPGFLTILAPGGSITAYLDDVQTITNLEAGTPCGE